MYAGELAIHCHHVSFEREVLVTLCRYAANFPAHSQLVSSTLAMLACCNGYPDLASYLDFHKLPFVTDFLSAEGRLQQLVCIQVGPIPGKSKRLHSVFY